MRLGRESQSTRAFVFLLLLALLAVQEVALAWQDGKEELESELEEYATWCDERQLHLDRAWAHELLLEFDAEHDAARRALGFTRAGKVWKAPSRPKKFTNRNPEAVVESLERRQALAQRHFERVLALLEDSTRSAAEVRAAEDAILRIDPAHAGTRARRRELLHEGEWVLSESASAVRRLPVLERIARDAFSGAPAAEVVAPLAHELERVLEPRVLATPHLRVVTTGDVEGAQDVARALGAAAETFRSFLGGNPDYPEDCSVYLLTNPAARAHFLEHHPAVSESMRAQYASIDGVGIPGTGDWAWWTSGVDKRTDGLLRFAFNWFLQSVFGIPSDQAWVHEGFGVYLTWRLTGTRLTWFINPSDGVDPRSWYALRSGLQDPALDWLEEARKLLEAKDPQFQTLFQRRLHELTVEDLLACHALAAYSVESFPERTPAFLKRLGTGASVASALRDEFSLSLEMLPERLLRWLRERKSLAEKVEPLLTGAELETRWKALAPERQAAVLASLRSRLAASSTRQLRLVRSLTALAAEEVWPLAEAPAFYDPHEHAPGQPIPRRWLDEGDSRSKRVLAEMKRPVGRFPALEYDWASASIVRRGEACDPAREFEDARRGLPPDLDLARALLLRALDGGLERKILAALGHAYTDREGNVYPGLTLFDAWCSKEVMEMPDVDALGLIHEVFDDWKTWQAPIPGTEHEILYGKIEGLFQGARRYRELREALADCFLLPLPTGNKEYEALAVNLHALWEHNGDAPGALGRRLPTAAGWQGFIDRWVAECKQVENGIWERGRRRQAELRRDGEAVVRALSDAVREEGGSSKASAERKRR